VFGCVVAGRSLQTNLQQIDDTHAAFDIDNAASVNHICVFLLGTVPLPPGYAATVHFHWPGRGFQLLGMISNEKPSAVFRLRGTYTDAAAAPQSHSAFLTPGTQPSSVTATLGIAIEPLDAVEAQMASLQTSQASQAPRSPQASSTALAPLGSGPGSASRLSDPAYLVERILTHLFNYLSSFAGPGTTQGLVELATIQRWYEMLVNKIRAGGVGFLDRTE